MRLDIPHDDRRYVRSQEIEVPPLRAPSEVEPAQVQVPASPLTRDRGAEPGMELVQGQISCAIDK
jgi:hypothetical protein